MISIRKLDGERIAISVPLHGKRVLLSGVGRFEADPPLGPALLIAIEDPAGNFDLLLKEAEWNGAIQRVEANGEYHSVGSTPFRQQLAPNPSWVEGSGILTNSATSQS